MINPDKSNIEYAAETRLLDLVEEACVSNKKLKRIDNFNKAASILYFLEVLVSYDDYIEDDQINNILECLKVTSGISNFPVSPGVNELEPPTVNIGPPGTTGATGAPGLDGFGTDYSQFDITTTTTLDSFDREDAFGAEWSYVIINSAGTSLRKGNISAGWISSGTVVYYDWSSADIGDTSPVVLSVDHFAATIRLRATISSGTWTIRGTRRYVPGNGSGTGVINTTLANGRILIGNTSNIATPAVVNGDITINNAGTAAIGTGVIVDADIHASAAIALTKLAPAGTPDRVAVFGGGGVLTVGANSLTELGYLSGVTSSIQTQLDSKVGSVTGAISTVVSSDLAANMAVISNALGKIAVHATVTNTELGYLTGATGNIQTAINSLLSSKVDDPFQTGINMKVINIGDWNMDSDTTKAIAHGVADYKKIREIGVVIRDDSDASYTKLDRVSVPTTLAQGGVVDFDGTNINLIRLASGQFDSTSYDSTSYNRGFITIIYAD